MLALAACDDAEDVEEALPLEVETVSNFHAPNDVIDRQTGQVVEARPFVKFSFSSGAEASGDAWDIAFKGTAIIVNGGSANDGVDRTGNAAAVILDGIFEEQEEAPEAAAFRQDTEDELAIPKGGGNGWYNYDPQNHLITPIAGKVLVIRTHDGRYAKMEILSYYKDAPATPNAFQDQSATYTFRYMYQADGSKQLK